MRQTLSLLCCAALALSGLWLILKPAPVVHDASETHAYFFAILEGSIPEPMMIELKLGDTAKLRFVSNKDTTVYIHGVDTHIALTAGIKKDIEFNATQTGRFDIEIRANAIQLATIKVYPR